MSAVDSQKYVAAQVRDHDYDRYFATLFCPADSRPALLALYAFNIEIAAVRETVSEPLIGQMRLQWWRDAIDAVFDERPPNHPVATAVADTGVAAATARELFHRLIDGRESDLVDDPRKDLAALEAYVEATSSNLVRLALAILGARGEDAERLARHAGLAWGLAGILRAVPFNRARQADTASAELPEGIAASASAHLETARRISSQSSREALGAVLPLACTPTYLRRLARAGGDPTRHGLDLSRFHRQCRMAAAAYRGRI